MVRLLINRSNRHLVSDNSQGKTLTMIALILATKDDIPKDFSNTTLIGKSLHRRAPQGTCCWPIQVVPLSVLSNWEKQIHDHCAPRALSCFAYYGTNRNILSSELTTYDIVLTTYQTVMNQFVPEKRSAKRAKVDLEKSLFDIRWKVCDSSLAHAQYWLR